MRVRISFDIPTMYIELTPEQQQALEESEESWDWQPFIDALYFQIEDHLMSEFVIDDVQESRY